MLSDKQIALLRQKGVKDFSEIEDYDENEQVVTMKDGNKHQLTEVWTRVMGYFRPYENFNVGKKSEFEERKYFKEDTACKHITSVAMAAE